MPIECVEKLLIRCKNYNLHFAIAGNDSCCKLESNYRNGSYKI